MSRFHSLLIPLNTVPSIEGGASCLKTLCFFCSLRKILWQFWQITPAIPRSIGPGSLTIRCLRQSFLTHRLYSLRDGSPQIEHPGST
jgi:hypothetical protein